MNIEVKVPDGKSGPWKIETFSISKDAAELANLRMAFKPGLGGRTIEAGTFKKLTRNGELVMSNAAGEISDHQYFIYKAKGSVLMNGLGLGVALSAILEKPEVEEVIIIEQSEDVIKLVAPSFQNDSRVTIVHADAFEWKPPKGKRYDVVWHDIWNNICTDNLPEMHTLHRKYGKRCNWQGSWCREICEIYK